MAYVSSQFPLILRCENSYVYLNMNVCVYVCIDVYVYICIFFM